ncbi:transcriptional regulator [Aliivibrio fischeri]|uniref:ogr/Delta-like zinc finger family protein n=1 Tax=Aliivibrio fischeri TaxID=668 RepID=UPI00080E0200|nr:ogr/Delta-like zinc finger family protein [Aliivibrio fischeri]OCH26232.1 transcriptional regulator [Aliivibrio fischeri]
MIVCPDCGASYRIETSRPISNEVREYYGQCKTCGIRFLLYANFKEFIVKNSESKPPNKALQPQIAQKRNNMLRLLSPEPESIKKPVMTFK